ncbi:MAG: hypothetical protein ACXWQZ_14210 [Ktedonobacterales bacterium]
MAVSVGGLDQRQMERLRVELVESIAATLAYPSFFDFQRGQAVARPVDRAKQEEIEQFVASVNFASLERVDITSLEVRRFLEQLLLRYLEVNPLLQGLRIRRRLPELRARVSRVVAEVQRGLVAHVEGRAPAFGTRRQRMSWAGSIGAARDDWDDEEHNTRVLEAALVRREADGPASHSPAAAAPSLASSYPSPPASYEQAPYVPYQSPAPQSFSPVMSQPAAQYGESWAGVPLDLTVPVLAQSAPKYDATLEASPFAALASGAQSEVYDQGGISERDTNEMRSVQVNGGTSRPASASSSGVQPRELPQDLYELYGDYLRDMHPESEVQESGPPPVVPDAPTGFSPFAPSVNGGGGNASTVSPVSHASAPPSPVHSYQNPAMVVQQSTLDPATARSDKLIFWQLRYQLEAYIRRAARSYGVQTESGDPSGVLDALRRSGFVDEADLRIAEGILALTDRVTAGATATTEDYRQALMLYLLYHRSHLNA